MQNLHPFKITAFRREPGAKPIYFLRFYPSLRIARIAAGDFCAVEGLELTQVEATKIDRSRLERKAS